MAIAGGGVPALRVSIYNRKLRQSGNAVNVPKEVVYLAEVAAYQFIENPKAFIYVNLTEGGGTVYLSELLEVMGLIDSIERSVSNERKHNSDGNSGT